MQEKNIINKYFKTKSRKEILKQARKIYKTFDNIDLRKNVNDYQYYKARRILKVYYSLQEKNIKIIKNKKIKENIKILKGINPRINKNFKSIPIPIQNKNNNIKFNEYGYTEFNNNFSIEYLSIDAKKIYKSLKNIKNIEEVFNKKILEETKKVFELANLTDKKLKSNKKTIRVLCGNYLSSTHVESIEFAVKTVDEWSNQYSNFKDWFRGFQISEIN